MPKDTWSAWAKTVSLGVFFIDFNLINDESSDPVKVDGADLYFAFEGFFDTFNGDLFDQLGKYNTVKIKSQGGQEK